MAQAEVIIFSAPTSPICRQVEEVLTRKGVKFRSRDISTDRDALRLLLRVAGRPTVPTIVAYGEVMVGFDADRLEEILEGLDERAETCAREEKEEEEQLRRSEAFVREIAEGEKEPTS